MSEHPFLFTYILGAYGFLAVALWALFARPEAFDLIRKEARDDLGIPPWVVNVFVLLAYSVFWPFPLAVLLAELWRRSRR